jgi:thimet oligopeptidase
VAAEQVLAEARRRLAVMERLPLEAVTPESVLDAWDGIAMMLEDAYGAISLLNSVHPEAGVRDAGDRALIEESVFMTELFQNEQLYERVRRVVPRTNAQKQLQKDLLEAFEDSGVSLAAEKRDRFKVISERITELAQEFSKNVRENKTVVTFTPEECDGMPQSYLDRVPRDDRGNIVLGFDYPDYVPFMSNASNGEARKRYYVANMNRGTDRNLEILDEIVALRKEIADLYEVPSFAHYATKRRMVENPETVTRFLDEVKNGVTEGAERSAATRGRQSGAERIGDRAGEDRALGCRLFSRAVARATLRRRSGRAAPISSDAADAALDARHHRTAVRHLVHSRHGAGVA